MSNIFANIYIILPELYLCTMAMFLLIMTVFRHKTVDNVMLGSALFSLFGAGWLLWPHLHAPAKFAWDGLFVTSGFIVFSKLLVLGAAAMVMLISTGWMKEGEGRPSEFLVLMLFATLGMLLMLSAADLLSLYMGLEMSSLALYVLASFERDHPKSSEAGLKYFVLGALASGMLLFGISLVYGFAGTTDFQQLGDLFGGATGPVSRGVLVGVVLIMVGFCFKLSAVPFHMWAPDVYEGAPTPVTAFFATAPKIAALALFTRLMLQPFGALMAEWQQIIVFMSVASMLVGALAAIMQTNIKRLLAYSSIGHVGFMLIGLAAGSQGGVQAMLIYLAVYIFMSAGAFGCVLLMRRGGHAVEEIRDLAGLSETRPAAALAMAIFMFSLAGIPPLAGFFGKMYIVLAAIQGGMVWLAVVGVVTSVIACYYYLKVVRVMYFDEPAAPFDAAMPLGLRLGIAIGALATLLFVLVPTPLVAQAMQAAEALLQ